MLSKKMFLGAAAAMMLSYTPANAQLVIQPVFNAPAPAYIAPAYAAPAPYYGGPVIEGYDYHHRRRDIHYWHDHGHDRDHGRR